MIRSNRSDLTLVLILKKSGMHSADYKKTFHEGLGVDHEEWLKAKKQQENQK